MSISAPNSEGPFLPGPLDLISTLHDLPRLLEGVINPSKEYLLVFDVIGSKIELEPIQSATSRNVTLFNERILGSIHTVVWLVKYVNNLYRSAGLSDMDTLVINGSFGDRIDVVTNPVVDTHISLASLLIVAMMLKSNSNGQNMRAMLLAESDDWWYEQPRDEVHNKIVFEQGTFPFVRRAAQMKQVNERTGILFSPKLGSLEERLVGRYLDGACIPVGGLWDQGILETTIDEIPKIELADPSIVATYTLVISGENSQTVSDFIMKNLLADITLNISGGPDGEKGWSWFSIPMVHSSLSAQEIRNKVLSIVVQADILYPGSIFLNATNTAIWAFIADQQVVIDPFATKAIPSAVSRLKDQNASGVFTIGDLPPYPYQAELNIGESRELVAQVLDKPDICYVETGNPSEDTGTNMARFILTQPLACFPGGLMTKAVELFTNAARVNDINVATFRLGATQLNNDIDMLPDAASIAMRGWLEGLEPYLQWVIACIGIVGDAAGPDLIAFDQNFMVLVRALLKDKMNVDIDHNGLNDLINNASDLSEPSSTAYNFASVMGSWAIDLLKSPNSDFRGFFQLILQFLIETESPEQIASSPYIRQVIPLLKFYKDAAATIPGIAELISPDMVTRASLGVCLYLHTEGLSYKDILGLINYNEVMSVGGLERELYKMLSLAGFQEDPEFNPYQDPNAFRYLLATMDETSFKGWLAMRLRMLVLGKDRRYSQYSDFNIERVGLRGNSLEVMKQLVARAQSLLYLFEPEVLADIGYLKRELPIVVNILNENLNTYLLYIHHEPAFKVFQKLISLRRELFTRATDLSDSVWDASEYAAMFIDGIQVEVYAALHQAASIRSLPKDFLDLDPAGRLEVCRADIQHISQLIAEFDMLYVLLDKYHGISGMGEDEYDSLTSMLREAIAIIKIRRANLVLKTGDNDLVEESLDDLNAVLQGESPNLILTSRSLINLLAMLGTFRKSDITMEEMTTWGGIAVVNAMRTGGDVFASMINVYAAFAEEECSLEHRMDLQVIFQDRKVVMAYRNLLINIARKMDQINPDLMKNYLEAILGIIFRYGIHAGIEQQLIDFLVDQAYERGIFNDGNRMVCLHHEAAVYARAFGIFKTEPNLIKEIGPVSYEA